MPCGPRYASLKEPIFCLWKHWNEPCKRRRRSEAFERAAALRDKWTVLHWLSGHLERLRQACRRSCVYPAAGRDGARDYWYLIRHGQVRAVVPAPRDAVGRTAAAAALAAVYRNAATGPPGPDEIDGVLLVAAWFRRYPAETEKTLEPAAALAACSLTGPTLLRVLAIQ